MSLHPNQVLLAPVVSEKSYRSSPTASTRSASTRTRTRRRSARRSRSSSTSRCRRWHRQGAVEAEAARVHEGPRPAGRRRSSSFARATRSRSSRGHPSDGLAQVQADEPRPPLHGDVRLRGDHEVGAREVAARAAHEEGRRNNAAASRRGTRVAATSAASARSTSSAPRTACRRRWPRSSTTPTGRPASRCCTTRTARRRTSSLRAPASRLRRRVGPERRHQARERAPAGQHPDGNARSFVELKPGQGARMARSAGSSVQLVAKDGDHGVLRLPSGELRRVLTCRATVGQVGNTDHANQASGKAGRSRWSGSGRPSAARR